MWRCCQLASALRLTLYRARATQCQHALAALGGGTRLAACGARRVRRCFGADGTLCKARAQVAAVLWRGRHARRPHEHSLLPCGGSRRPRHHRLGRRHRQGLAVTPDAARQHHALSGSDDSAELWRHHRTTPFRRWRCCRPGRASSVARATTPRSCGRSTARLSAPSERTFRRWSSPSRRCPTACTFWWAISPIDSRCSTSTGRWSAPEGTRRWSRGAQCLARHPNRDGTVYGRATLRPTRP